jgi:hypothetical protein
MSSSHQQKRPEKGEANAMTQGRPSKVIPAAQEITTAEICKFSQNESEEQESISTFSVWPGGSKQ